MENDIAVLLDRVKKGDEVAFAELSNMYKTLMDSAVYRFSRSLETMGDGAAYELDDLKQYAAMAVFRAAISYEPYTDGKGKSVSFGLYAKICVNNALVSVLRKQKTALRKAERMALKSREQFSAGQTDPLDGLISSEGAQDLLSRIRVVLSEYESEVFAGYIAGKPVREIATELDVSEKSVSNALYRVKIKIKDLLKNQ